MRGGLGWPVLSIFCMFIPMIFEHLWKINSCSLVFQNRLTKFDHILSHSTFASVWKWACTSRPQSRKYDRPGWWYNHWYILGIKCWIASVRFAQGLLMFVTRLYPSMPQASLSNAFPVKMHRSKNYTLNEALVECITDPISGGAKYLMIYFNIV